MNGFVASLTRPSTRRLLRGLIFLVCCVLSISLIGAVHTRTRDDDRRVEADRSPVLEDRVELAAYQPPTVRTLVTPSEAMAEVEPATARQPSFAEARAVVASIASNIQKALSGPTPAPTASGARPRVIWMEVTAYCACKKCCGPRAQGVTASGRPVSHNGGRFVAADTRLLKFNTKLIVPGYADGAAVPVIDRGGAIKGTKLDVYFASHQEARQWGRRWVPVTVLD